MSEPPAAGSPAPPFTLAALGGGERSLAELTSQGPVALVFFKVSCPVCQLTLPFIERMARGGVLRFVAISQDDDEATRRFNDRFGIGIPTLLDRQGEDYPVSNAYGLTAVPTVFLVAPDGRVERTFSGFSKAAMEDLGRRAEVTVFREDEAVPAWKAG